jgi:uncharacterized Zn-finger protein
MGPVEVIHVDKKKVSCDGGRGASNHPLVYLQIKEDQNYIACPYCSRYFTTKESVDIFNGQEHQILKS